MPPKWGLSRTTVSSQGNGSASSARGDSPGKKHKTDGKQTYTRRSRAQLTDSDKSQFSLADDAAQQRFMTVICKGLLNCSQRLRTVEGVLQDVFITDSGHSIVKELAATMQSYQQQCQDKGQGHDLGAPIPYLWSTLLDTLIQCDIGQASRAAVQTVKELVDSSSDPATVYEHCRHIHCKSCHDKKNHKLTLMIPDRSSRQAVIQAMNQLQVDHKATRPPAGPVEDQLEKYLQILEQSD